nr:aspartic proteinase CDR1-like [Quercus suber]POF03477.1 aspartic proteinase cdr1 [Quercus suber]
MACPHSLPYLVALATTFSIVILCSLSLIEASNDGFSVELMHRDSPKSPFYDPTETPQQRLANALRRSINRVNHFRPTSSFSTNALDSEIIPTSGEYLMKYAVGTPPVQVLGIADTGSDLTWLQCKPCTHCYNQTDPIFDPAKSSTYKIVPCTAPQCKTISGRCVRANNCEYIERYGDGSSSGGDLGLDTVTLGSTAKFPQTIIGCGHDNTGVFNKKGSGIVGLGGSAISLVSQLSTSIAGKFSYCLVPFDKPAATSKLNFGTNAVVSGPGVVTTPLGTGETDVYYTLALKAISVGPTKISTASATAAGGNIIIDSGTTLTFLPSDMYTGFEAALKAQIKLRVVPDPQNTFNLCFDSPESTFKVPTIIAHFAGGADVTLSATYTFLGDETISCMAFAPAGDSVAIIGNLAQADQLVGYDIVKRTVSFKPTDCTKA